MSNLTTNTTTIQNLISKINNLPSAGSGGGGSVETCTVTFAIDDMYDPDIENTRPGHIWIAATKVENGVKSNFADWIYSGDTLVVEKNSFIATGAFGVISGGFLNGGLTTSFGEDIIYGGGRPRIYSIVVTNDCTITISF